MTPPTYSELYLAFRQAKIALYYERRGVGLIELARYENRLETHLRRLRSRLGRGDGWFDMIGLGEAHVVPKRLRDTPVPDRTVVRVGPTQADAKQTRLETQLRLSPSPDFATVEILYLREFGPVLDAVLSRNVIGYRLHIKADKLSPTRRLTFEHWQPRYQEFRTAPLREAKKALARKIDSVMIVSVDLASFYDTIDPTFLLHRRFLGELARTAERLNLRFSVSRFIAATKSLLSAYARFRAIAEKTTGLEWKVGIPIGALTSRVVANLSLRTVDDRIEAKPNLLCYRRYVDDMVMVTRSSKNDASTLDDVLSDLFPIKNREGGRVLLDGKSLRRPGCDFEIKVEKARVHHLTGVPGDDFLNAVTSDFQRLVSEQRAFVDSSLFERRTLDRVISPSASDGSPLRVMRDADRIQLARFALSTHLRSLERVSVLLGPGASMSVVKRIQDRFIRALRDEGNWVDNLDLTLRLLRVALGTQDEESATTLVDETDIVWKTVKNLRHHVGALEHRGRPMSKLSAWTSLRDYMHARRLQAIAASMVVVEDGTSCLPDGVTFRRKRIPLIELQQSAALLAMADLRDRDREDDSLRVPTTVEYDSWMRSLLSRNSDLLKRFNRIARFVKRCRRLSDTAWQLPPARLFLCTRPPSYFDIARRWLYYVERRGFRPDVFEVLLRVVNAIRGTEYRDAVGEVIDPSTVRISPTFADLQLMGPAPEPRLVMANLPVNDDCFDGAATRVPGSTEGLPRLTWERLRNLNETLEKARSASRGVPNVRGLSSSLVVFPELSIPRAWLRMLANHTVDTTNVGLLVGVEYLHDLRFPHVLNQAIAVLPGPFKSVVTWPWTKLRPARGEADQLAAKGLRFPPVPKIALKRTVVQSQFGDFSTLICSELLEATLVAQLLGRVDLVLIPSWNKDTTSYEHLLQAAGLQLHAFLAIANNGQYSDCRAWAPFERRFKRDLCRLLERHANDVVSVNLPLAALRRFHRSLELPGDPEWLPLPPGM